LEFTLFHNNLPFNLVTILAIICFTLPILTFLVLLFAGHLIKRADNVATGLMFVNFLLALFIFIQTFGGQVFHTRFAWVNFGEKLLPLTIGIKIDFLSALLLVIVTFISSLVHLYSKSYMHSDKQYVRYFAYLNTFTASMIGILLGDNLFAMFVFWELVGLTSYLLIGFWYQKNSAVRASKKAFLLNRIGDLGFLVGIMTLWSQFGTLDLEALYIGMKNSEVVNGMWSVSYTVNGFTIIKSLDMMWLTIAGLGIFCGCIGKSAQFPLQIWLPDAMEGPTPVSALIHAATMVAAGVYLLARVFPLLDSFTLDFIAIIGCISAFMGAYAAVSQFDIKRILAFSTISQLGYMVMAMGVGAYQSSLFHLTTHAFFKAGLFLCVGAVIHALHHLQESLEKKHIHLDFDVQNVHLMGGLKKVLPFTYLAYFVTAWAAMGMPFSSGFLSKDAIVAATWGWAQVKASQGQVFFYVVPLVAFTTGFVTAFYMGRQLFVVFWGENRLQHIYSQAKDALKHIHEIDLKMKIPLVLLASLSFFFWFSFNPLSATDSWFYHQILAVKSVVPQHIPPLDLYAEATHHVHIYAIILSVFFAFAGFGAAYLRFGKQKTNTFTRTIPISSYGILQQLSTNNFFLDDLFKRLITKPGLRIALYISYFDKKVIDKTVDLMGVGTVLLAHITAGIDKYGIDGSVNATASLSRFIGRKTSHIQNGKIQSYLTLAILGVVVMGVILFLVG